jgi:hypothetical protein
MLRCKLDKIDTATSPIWFLYAPYALCRLCKISATPIEP